MKPIVLTEEAKLNALEIFKKLLEESDGTQDLRINITAETLLQKQGVQNPIVYVSSTAYVKMMSLITSSDKELAWHGTATRVNNNYFIEDIYVYPQTVTSTTVDADEQACAKWYMELSDETINNLKFQGHSHVSMPASPSGRDTDNWLKFANLLKPDEFYIVCIGNKRGEFYWNIYDKAINVCFENKDITMIVVDEKGNSITEWATEAVKKYIKTVTPSYTAKQSTLNLNGVKYNVVDTLNKTNNAKTSKKDDSYVTSMLSYVPEDLRADVDYEIETDTYYTDVVGLPCFSYSGLYGCYVCRGDVYRRMNSTSVVKSSKKENKKTGKKGVKTNESK